MGHTVKHCSTRYVILSAVDYVWSHYQITIRNGYDEFYTIGALVTDILPKKSRGVILDGVYKELNAISTE